jgi:hypothetical protein
MSSVTRSVLGAALLLTGASAAMAQSANPPLANQTVQTNTSTATVASNNAPLAAQPQKPKANIADKSDTYGGYDPNSLAGARAFWQGQNTY